jgi:hypothetical protein
VHAKLLPNNKTYIVEATLYFVEGKRSRMKKFRFLVSLLLLFSIAATVFPARSARLLSYPSGWTFMVYMDADNNIESGAINDFASLASVGSTADLNTVVQMDRIPGYDSQWGNWTDCKRYFVTYNQTPTPENAIQDLGEVNMGDPNTLSNFAIWAMQTYPAQHYALVLWDHGAGIYGVCVDATDNNDGLDLLEIRNALANITGTVSKKIDFLGFDACLMGMIEVACQAKDYADTMVASEEVFDGYSNPDHPVYYRILSNLKNNPSMPSDELAREIVTYYSESPDYETIGTPISAVNLDLPSYTTMDTLAAATNNFAEQLLNGLPTYQNEIMQASNQSRIRLFDSIDLYHFAQLVRSLVSDPGIQDAAEQVMSNLTNNLIAEAHGSDNPNPHGLAIYFPLMNCSCYHSYYLQYEDLDFSTATNWNEFLKKVLGVPYRDIAITNVTTSRTVVYKGEWLWPRITVTLVNKGECIEQLCVSIYANTTLIATFGYGLDCGLSANVSFDWNPAAVAGGTYAITAIAAPLPLEMNTTDNTYTCRQRIEVAIRGDVNHDFLVNIKDATQIGLYWMETVPPAPSNVDINGDGIIDIKDASIVGVNWQKHA